MRAEVMSNSLLSDLQQHLEVLSCDIGPRPVGSAGNRRAEEYIARELESAGYEVRHQRFDCEDWELRSASVQIDGFRLQVRPNSYSTACDVHAPLVAAHTFEDLQSLDLHGRDESRGRAETTRDGHAKSEVRDPFGAIWRLNGAIK